MALMQALILQPQTKKVIMSVIKSFAVVAVFSQVFFSCSSDSIAGKPSEEKKAPFRYRGLDSTEKLIYQARLSQYFDSMLNGTGFSGGILVAKNGQILYEHYQGFSDAASSEPIDEETPFHVASTSKTFTSTAIMQLVEQGKIKLEDSLQTYFPQFPYGGMTVRNLLNHSTGIPNYANFFANYKWDRKKNATNADVLFMLYANRPALEFTTGTRFRYCNTNFALLALIVEKVSGQKFPNYVRDSIFTPCGMSSSYIVSTENPGSFMPSWTGGRRMYGFDYLDGIYGDKNVFTTARDLLKYDSCIRENVLLKAETYQEMWTPNFPDRHYRDTTEYYGLGWRLKIFNDSLKIPYHNGWWHGNNSVFQRLIADTAVIIVTGNRMSNLIYRSAKAANIFRHYYDVKGGEVAEENAGQDGTSSIKEEPVREIRTTKKKAAVVAPSKKTKARQPAVKAGKKAKAPVKTKKEAPAKKKKKR